MAHPDHNPMDNFEGLIAWVHNKFLYSEEPVSGLDLHNHLVSECGLTPEYAHLVLRAAWFMGG